MVRTVQNMCPTCSPTLEDKKSMTVTINPPSDPTITHSCGYSATFKDYSAARAQVAENACKAKYPNMYL